MKTMKRTLKVLLLVVLLGVVIYPGSAKAQDPFYNAGYQLGQALGQKIMAKQINLQQCITGQYVTETNGHLYFKFKNVSGMQLILDVTVRSTTGIVKTERIVIRPGEMMFLGPTSGWQWYFHKGDTFTLTVPGGKSVYWTCPSDDNYFTQQKTQQQIQQQQQYQQQQVQNQNNTVVVSEPVVNGGDLNDAASKARHNARIQAQISDWESRIQNAQQMIIRYNSDAASSDAQGNHVEAGRFRQMAQSQQNIINNANQQISWLRSQLK